jgi:hypothetical protein
MIRERNYFTIRDASGWNEALEMIHEIDEVQAAAGRATSTVWTQVAGPFYEIVIEVDYPDLASYEREQKAFNSDPQIAKMFGRWDEVTVPGKGRNELFMTAERAGA